MTGQGRVVRPHGSSEIRYVLNLMALPLIGRKKLFGDYYWKKKDHDRMPGEKDITCVMRKILSRPAGMAGIAAAASSISSVCL